MLNKEECIVLTKGEIETSLKLQYDIDSNEYNLFEIFGFKTDCLFGIISMDLIKEQVSTNIEILPIEACIYDYFTDIIPEDIGWVVITNIDEVGVSIGC